MMKDLDLLIQNSAGVLSLGLARAGELLSESQSFTALAESRAPHSHLSALLAALDAPASAIGRIFVDIGPGGLGATRGSVAFANALAFALDRPIHGVCSFELIGSFLAAKYQKPVCVIRPAARPDYYFGTYDAGALQLRFINKTELLELTSGYMQTHTFAGKYNLEDLPAPELNDAPIAHFAQYAAGANLVPHRRVYPITEDLDIRYD